MKSDKSLINNKIKRQLQQTPVAIIGMGCIFPQARTLEEYWENIITKTDCISDVPPSRWRIEDYYDPDPKAPDKTYCKRGGFIPDIDFDPMEFGLPPNILEVTDVAQMLSLVVAKQAMEDAGYGESRDFNRKGTGVILGVGGGQKLITPLTARLQYPVWEKVLKNSGVSDEDTQKIIEKIKLAYIGWEENSFPGMLGNVIAGRIANRLDLGGINCVVDAACAGSLSALRMALSELTEYRSDMMIAGGVDADNSIFMYMCFSKTPAFSKEGNSRPFDINSDGMLLGEGMGMMVLKRLEDAERDGDRIYAVIKGMGTSSDGKSKSIYAPRSEGQAVALRRAYEDAGFAPSTVGLIEAHGTGTVAGDPTEFAGLNEVFSQNNSQKQHIALGSVKSQIGHTKATAGAASLIKTALALHHKILPPTINVTQPNPKLKIEDSPFYLNTETRPWLGIDDETPRRAGVSAFGFGGTNYHVVLEEYQREHQQAYRLHSTPATILLDAPTVGELLAKCETLESQLASDRGTQHYTELVSAASLKIPVASARVGFVATSAAEARELLQITIDLLKNKQQAQSWEHPKGIYYRKTSLNPQGKVVALFSGQGSQYLEMGKELVLNFPQLRQAYSDMDKYLGKNGLPPISQVVFPCPVFDNAQKDAQIAALQQTENAQPAIGALSFGLYKIIEEAGFKPDYVAGHSFGELTALWAAGVLNDEDYFFLVKARGQAMAFPDDPKVDTGMMLAVKGDIYKVKEVVENFPKITIANWNSNNQVVLAGAKGEIAKVQQKLEQLGYSVVLLPVSAAFHSPFVAHAQKRFAEVLDRVTFNQPKIPVYSNTTGNLYPDNSHTIGQTLAAHIVNPVHFKQEVENIYAAGGYFFVEIGPRNILTNLVKNILEDRPHLAIALNASSKGDSQRQLCEAFVQLRVAGLSLDNLDPYLVKSKTSNSQQKKRLNVPLNGANYVSEKTKAAFEHALQNGHQIKGNPERENRNGKLTQEPKKSLAPKPTPHIAPIPTPQPVIPVPVIPQVKMPEPIPVPPATKSEAQPMQQSSVNNQGLLESLERNMMRFHEHQAASQQVHEQYLKNQLEYSQRFFQLMQQHYSLLGAGNGANGSVVNGQASIAPVRNFEQGQNGQGTSDKPQYSVVSPTATTVVPTPEKLIHSGLAAPEIVPTVPVSPVSSNGSQPAQARQVETNGLQNQIAQAEQAEVAPSIIEKTSSPSVTAPAVDLTPLIESLLEVVSEKTGYPTEMLELSMDMEADLGIDSIKRVEILGAMQELFPDLPPVNPEQLAELRTLAQIVEYMGNKAPSTEVEVSAPAAAVSAKAENGFVSQEKANALIQSLLEVVSEKTGYPTEMLELSMDMEADLGIDSIKRVEILGAMQELFPDLPPVNPEQLAELRTLAQIVEYMSQESRVAEKKT
ncbi:acyltransferase domain-containing protein [Trichocoleus sp. Lan]|uniref:beta-ketoacyl synthase N-terminal-like domain-containing protein n=1 Tax=Trichocoleus sp. Lan TaxID=2933927 RepID=UPI0032994AC8